MKVSEGEREKGRNGDRERKKEQERVECFAPMGFMSF